MNINKQLNPYANLSLRRQLFLESRAMAEYALSKGQHIPLEVIHTIEGFEDEFKIGAVPKANEANSKKTSFDSSAVKAGATGDIELLVATHDVLAKI
ncbi:MAG: hypothetical protein D3923_08025, partial [Candidatus Electrothrix sp. AR3]|nr:hypothetical protein [Candidatus Electrothrix sp. AR3]